jgi:integrase/recombinase XerD
MSQLSTSLKAYLSLRRSLGFKLKEAGRALPQFVAFLNRRGVQSITTKLTIQWAAESPTAKPAYRAQRLSLVRGFAKYLSGLDPRTEIAPPGVLPYGGNRRRKPHIYTKEEIQRLLQATQAADSLRPIRSKTYATIFGLLAVTGMRLSECLNLDDAEVDLAEAVLTIRGSKWRKSRLVPIHATTVRKLAAYRRERNQLHPRRPTPAFFILDQGNRPKVRTAEKEFLRVARRIGLRGPLGTKGPRLHDLRHTFAVDTLFDWYGKGVDVERHTPELSTYLGHSHVAYTYWYLSAEPKLLALAATRLENLKGIDSHEKSH